MMTRKDFAALAHALNCTRPARPNTITVVSTAEARTWSITMEGIIEVCAASNPRFDSDRFRAACTVDITPEDWVYPADHTDGID